MFDHYDFINRDFDIFIVFYSVQCSTYFYDLRNICTITNVCNDI